jgi:hypothetical protein
MHYCSLLIAAAATALPQDSDQSADGFRRLWNPEVRPPMVVVMRHLVHLLRLSSIEPRKPPVGEAELRHVHVLRGRALTVQSFK